MITKFNRNSVNVNNNNSSNERSSARVSILAVIALMLVSLFSASCGGGTSAINMDEAAPKEGTGAAAAEGDKGVSGSYYNVTSAATYVEGLDYLFKLNTDGCGNYEFVLVVTNYSGGPKQLCYNNGQRYDFAIERNGQLLYNWAYGRFFNFATFTDTLQHGEKREFREFWNGRGNNGHPIPAGMAKASVKHTKSPVVSLSADGYLDGKYI